MASRWTAAGGMSRTSHARHRLVARARGRSWRGRQRRGGWTCRWSPGRPVATTASVAWRWCRLVRTVRARERTRRGKSRSRVAREDVGILSPPRCFVAARGGGAVRRRRSHSRVHWRAMPHSEAGEEQGRGREVLGWAGPVGGLRPGREIRSSLFLLSVSFSFLFLFYLFSFWVM